MNRKLISSNKETNVYIVNLHTNRKHINETKQSISDWLNKGIIYINNLINVIGNDDVC
jgi:hypothetical protein